MATAVVSGVGDDPSLSLLGFQQPSLTRKLSGKQGKLKGQIRDDDDLMRKREILLERRRSLISSVPVGDDYDDIDFEIEDIQEFLVSGIEYFIQDVEIPLVSPEPLSLFDLLNSTLTNIISPVSTPPIYFKKWMIDQFTNRKQHLISSPLDIYELKNIGLYDYYIDTTKTLKEGGLPLEQLLQYIVMYILAIRTGDLSFFPDIQTEIRPLLL
jgi:hypothetical protein